MNQKLTLTVERAAVQAARRATAARVQASTDSLYGSLKTDKKPPTAAQLRQTRAAYARRKYAR